MDLKSPTALVFAALLVFFFPSPALSWGNGFSIHGGDAYTNWSFMWNRARMFGTHDYLAYYAMSWLPPDESYWIVNETFFYGTELPDSKLREGWDDSRCCQHIIFNPNGSVADDVMAQRAMRKYNLTLDLLSQEKNDTASKWAGSIVHYVSEAGLWGNVLPRSVSSFKFEHYILMKTDIVFPSSDFESLFGGYLAFDGLDNMTPYEAVLRVANATYFGGENGDCNAKWMEKNYDIDDPEFLRCAGRNFNNIINAVADVLHSIYIEAKGMGEIPPSSIDWTSDQDNPSVDLNIGNPSYGENETVTANVTSKIDEIFYNPDQSWALYKVSEENGTTMWDEIPYLPPFDIPPCGALCSDEEIEPPEIPCPDCVSSRQQNITWIWNQKVPVIRNISELESCLVVSTTDSCYEMVNATPGTYGLSFKYLWRCPHKEDFLDDRNPDTETLNGTFTLDFSKPTVELMRQPPPPQPEEVKEESSNTWSVDFTILAYMAIIIGAVFAGLFVIRQVFILKKRRGGKKMAKRKIDPLP
ncbi:MAG: hypothetical protein JXB14_08395 [Candidatus Altiarchaeota archaeon]|nr:hypothetical protein [Candidatus Altiarchaeota archaeon]